MSNSATTLDFSDVTVMKFGGTSVGSIEMMHNVKSIVTGVGGRRIVVLSAMAGTTNRLVEISQAIAKRKYDIAASSLFAMRSLYLSELLPQMALRDSRLEGVLAGLFDEVEKIIKKPTRGFEKQIVAIGEMLSTNMFVALLQNEGIDCRWLYAPDFVVKKQNGKVNIDMLKERLSDELDSNSGCNLFVIQGFICSDFKGRIDNLERGGSDYTATLIGAALHTNEVQIWTDIDGVHNADPRVCRRTVPLKSISIDDASQLALCGAKILHPLCLEPLKETDVVVSVKNTYNPEHAGTRISRNAPLVPDVMSIATRPVQMSDLDDIDFYDEEDIQDMSLVCLVGQSLDYRTRAINNDAYSADDDCIEINEENDDYTILFVDNDELSSLVNTINDNELNTKHL